LDNNAPSQNDTKGLKSSNGGIGWGPTGEKTHVIKVLEHESKIFNFEKKVVGNSALR